MGLFGYAGQQVGNATHNSLDAIRALLGMGGGQPAMAGGPGGIQVQQGDPMGAYDPSNSGYQPALAPQQLGMVGGQVPAHQRVSPLAYIDNLLFGGRFAYTQDKEHQRALQRQMEPQTLAYISSLPPAERAAYLANTPEWGKAKSSNFGFHALTPGSIGAFGQDGQVMAAPVINNYEDGRTISSDPLTGQVTHTDAGPSQAAWLKLREPKYVTTPQGGTSTQVNPLANGDMGAPQADGSAPSPPQTPQASGGFDAIYDGFTAPHEGGYTASDGNGAPANYGINQKSNPGIDVKSLTPEGARKIMHDNYWVPSGAENVKDPALQAILFDTAVNMGPGAAKDLYARSGGDPQKFLQLRDARFRAIAAANPDKAKNLPVWLQRNQDLSTYVSGMQGAPQGQPAPMQQGGPPAVIHGQAPPKPQYRMLTPDEARAKGLDPSQQYQQSPEGKIEAAPGAAPYALTGNPDKTGEDYLNTVPPAYAAQIRGMARGDLPLPSPRQLTTPAGQKLMGDLMQYDPTANAANLQTRTATRKDFTSGAASKNITSLNTALGHMESLDEAIDGLHNNSFGMFNAIGHTWQDATHTADPALVRFRTERQSVADEVTKVFRGTGGTEADVQAALKPLDDANSPEALHTAVKSLAALLKSRMEALSNQYKNGMQTTDEAAMASVAGLLTPHARAAMKRFGQDIPDPGGDSNPDNPPMPGAVRSKDGWNVEDPTKKGSYPVVQYDEKGPYIVGSDGQRHRWRP